MSRKRRLVLTVHPAPAVSLPGLREPVTVIPIEAEEGRRVVVFVLRGEERALMTDPQVGVMAQALGNLVHPASCALVVTPAGSTLAAYELLARGSR